MLDTEDKRCWGGVRQIYQGWSRLGMCEVEREELGSCERSRGVDMSEYWTTGRR